jgi:hypothetical protein
MQEQQGPWEKLSINHIILAQRAQQEIGVLDFLTFYSHEYLRATTLKKSFFVSAANYSGKIIFAAIS